MADRKPQHIQCPVNEASCQYLDELHQLRLQVANLEREARTDALTGLFNYRHFEEILSQEMERVRRSGLPMVLLLCDVDHFKEFNDSYGHEAGNRMLQKVARTIDQQLRQLDTACRYGGEEFALILPNTGLTQAAGVSERVRAAVERIELALASGQQVTTSLSLGLASFSSDDTLRQAELIALADQQLYLAKNAGRNCVAVPKPRPPVTATAPMVSAAEKAALFSGVAPSRQNESSESDGKI